MLKSYRRRFVAYTMLLVGLALLLTFAVLDIVMYRSDSDELENTMRLIVEPWNDRSIHAMRGGPPPSDDGTADGRPPVRPDGASHGPMAGDGQLGGIIDGADIITVFYNESTGDISVIPDDASYDPQAIAGAAEEIAASAARYGTAKSYGLIYYIERMDGFCKIALADRSYLTRRLIKNTLVLLLAYAAAMGLFLIISLRLSRLAARPMEDAINMERQFVADISHDLKTPITVVLANNSILRSNPGATAAEQSQWIESTDTAARSMMGMVEEMLTLSSLEAPGRTVEKVPVDLSAAGETSVLQMESLAYERGVELTDDIREGLFIMGDRDYAERICGGLIENALKYEGVGGRVHVALTAARKKAVFSVKNSSSYIVPEDIPHIFERFYRGDKARSSKSGHGLGLPIIKQMAELIGATVTVESGRDTGTVFTVTFELTDRA